MKVLLTHERFAPDFAGGGELVALETARYLRIRGVNVRVCTTGDPRLTDYDGIPVVRLPVHRYRLNLKSGTFARLAADVDVIHTFNYHACWPAYRAAKTLNKPVVCTILGLFGDVWRSMRSNPLVGTAYEAVERFLLTRKFDRILFLSEYSRQVGIRMGVTPQRTLITSPGIRLESYTPAKEKDDVVLFVGKLDARKGIDDLLAVARSLPDVQFELFGWGERKQAVAARAPRNVVITEFERGGRLQEKFSRARIFLFPSLAETFGIAVLEAMASGCAVVSTTPMGQANACVRAGDVDGMALVIRQLWNDRVLCSLQAEHNRRAAFKFTWDSYIDKVLCTYEQVLSESRRRDSVPAIPYPGT